VTESPARAERGLVWRWGPAIAWMGLIFVLSAQPGLKVSADASVDGPVRHLAHIAVYAVLAVLITHGLGALGRPLSVRTTLIVALLTVGYGVTDEVHQAFVPDRTANAVDVGYDAVGAVIGVVAVGVWGRSGVRRIRPSVRG